MGKKVNLPYGLTFDNVLKLLDEVKKRPSSTNEELELRIGKTYPRSKHAAIDLDLIKVENNRLELTESGKNIAWETELERKQEQIFSHILMRYEPYEVAINRMARGKEEIIFTNYIQQIWAREMDFKLNSENLSKAVSFFFQLLHSAGLGKVLVGRHGAKTRFIFTPNSKSKILNFQIPVREGSSISEDDKQSLEISEDLNDIFKQKATVTPTKIINQIDNKFEPKENWSKLETDFFSLRIEKSVEAWDLLNVLMPIYRKKLDVDKLRSYENAKTKTNDVIGNSAGELKDEKS
jgi:hypothetical protein